MSASLVSATSRPSSVQERARSRQSSREADKVEAKRQAKILERITAQAAILGKAVNLDAALSVVSAPGSDGNASVLAALAAEEAKLAIEAEKMAELERRFAQEMVEMDLNEKWEKSIVNIPEQYRGAFKIVIEKYSVFIKIKMYKLLDLLKWTEEASAKLLHILHVARDLQVGNAKIDWWFDKMAGYTAEGNLAFVFSFLTTIDDKVLQEIFLSLSDEDLDKCIELARFLDPVELGLMHQYIFELTIVDVLRAMDEAHDPFAKACRLCRTRKLYALELRLVHDQVPPKMIRVTGALPLYDKAEKWAAADENLFTLDPEKGQVMWCKQRVDMTRICDQCLADCFAACTSDGRFDDLWVVPANKRKALLAELRGREQQLAVLIGKLAIERTTRRTREWATRALQAQRLGQRKEREAREAKELAEDEARQLAIKHKKKDEMMARATSLDPKWREEAASRDAKDLSLHVHTANLNYQLDYTRENPAPITREHPHSWENAHYLPDGTPMSPVAAVERFGTFTIKPNVQLGQLKEWKQRAIESNEDFERRIESYKEKQRAAELKSFEEHVEYVDKRIKRLKRQEQRLARTLDLEEQARVDKRAADRQARAAIRWAKMEANERYLMEVQDDRSNRLRFFQWECLQIEREREGMWFEECEQCSTDKFWGFFVEEARLKAINDKYKAFYEGRIQETRKKLILSKQIRPFKIEADMKIFKNPFTGEVLK
jgi:hypothetical protein